MPNSWDADRIVFERCAAMFVEHQEARRPNYNELAYARAITLDDGVTLPQPRTDSDIDARIRSWLSRPGADPGGYLYEPFALSHLRMEPDGWHTALGTRWQIRGATAFPAVALVKAGEINRVDEWFAYIASIPGLNALRFFLTKKNWNQGFGHGWDWELLPDGGTLDAIDQTFALALKYRLYGFGVGICDAPFVGLTTLALQQEWSDACTRRLAKHVNVAGYTKANEPWDGENQVDPTRIDVDPSLGLIVDHGCGNESMGPYPHEGTQCASYHIPRVVLNFGEPGWVYRVLDGPGFIKTGYTHITTHRPAPGSVFHAEPYWISNGTNPHHPEGPRNPTPDDAFEFARGASAPHWCGSFMHPDSFQIGRIPDPLSAEAYRIAAWAEGWMK